MVGFIIKAPLAKHQISATFFDSEDLVSEILLFLLCEFLVVFCRGEFDFMFSFRLGRFKSHRKYTYSSVSDFFHHLRV